MGGPRCPRCGQGKLFEGMLTVAPRCASCGLDLARLDTGDSATGLVVLFLGAITVGLAILLEILIALHVVLWVPLVIGGAILLLRIVKAWLIGQHFRHIVT
ncbi:MAG: DUF983 domain-containing protein [Stellaceae bacterium]